MLLNNLKFQTLLNTVKFLKQKFGDHEQSALGPELQQRR